MEKRNSCVAETGNATGTPPDRRGAAILEHLLAWQEQGQTQHAIWGSQHLPAPKQIEIINDTCTAGHAYARLQAGVALLYRGDYHNARQLLQAVTKRMNQRRRPPRADASLLQRFHAGRLQQAQQAALLGRLVIPVEAGYRVALRRAPDAAAAALAAWGPCTQTRLIPLREWLGVIGAWQWHLKGVPVTALGGATVHPNYGVFAPIRQEYLKLVASAPLPKDCRRALDLGTGTGIIAAILARRGIAQVVASDIQPQAVQCAQQNLQKLGLSQQVTVVAANLYPEASRFSLVVCNPPWLPGKVSSALDAAIYDPDSQMLHGFLQGLASHLEPDGEGWLVMSDLAERLGLREPQALQQAFTQAGLRVVGSEQTRPEHRRSLDTADPLHEARAAEITWLWRLQPA